MEDKLHQFFSENDFDFQEPNLKHEKRFEQKLNKTKTRQRKDSWKLLSVAASILLIFGFYLGKNSQNQQLDLADVSPKMEEVQNYFVTAISQEIKSLETNRSLDTETVIEEALHQIEELEDNYRLFVLELNNTGSKTKIINSMIKNYQQRLEILENVLEQIEQIKNPNLLNNEIYI
ncbi:hypothetical protein [Polaribacter porphyrae]|uniref:Anti-sigma factor n=1 Tax=Polaribacter porphyrae TaxID=1137780 RepID=A0A2S7WL58_9FLAO|nr:hypothetical protein [Polaribacter porphyrae]PQJ78032.1 hypothetical protein BTO18_01980 [Polaribacter porphyrae]